MRSADFRQLTLRAIGGFGAAIFGFFFLLTFHTPEWVETFAADFIEQRASLQVDRKIDSLRPPEGESALSRMAGALYAKNAAEIERRREALKLQMHERIAAAIAEIRNLDCECRAKWAECLKQGSETRIVGLLQVNTALREFVQSTYVRVVENLKSDIRIFTAANGAAFLLLVVVTFLKPRAILQLFVPALLLGLATITCSYFYIFEQNWLLTIIYNDYIGFAYLGYLLLVFGLLSDIGFNRARITTELLNAVLQAIGSATVAVPC